MNALRPKSSVIRGLTTVASVALLYLCLGRGSAPTWRLLLDHVPPSVELFAVALLIALGLSIALVYAILVTRSPIVFRLVALSGTVLRSIPFFCLVLMTPVLVMLATRRPYDFGWASSDRFSLGDRVSHVAIPACLVALVIVGIIMEALQRHGLAQTQSLSLSDAILKYLRAITARLPEVFGAQILVEILFAWPGLGRLFYNAEIRSDLAAPWTIILVAALVTIAMRCGVGEMAPVRSGPIAKPRLTVAAVLGAVGVIALLVTGTFAANPDAIDVAHWMGTPLPPCFLDAHLCGGHVLGTDEIGRDLFARLTWGAKITLGLSFIAALIASIISFAGLWLARSAPSVRMLVAGVSNGVSALLPWPMLAVLSSALFTHGHDTSTILVLVITTAVIRTAMLLREAGSGSAIQIVFVSFPFQWASAMLLLSTIDFFGEGVQPPTSSWGNMLANAQVNMQIAWWAAVLPAACLFLALLLIRSLGVYLNGGFEIHDSVKPASTRQRANVLSTEQHGES